MPEITETFQVQMNIYYISIWHLFQFAFPVPLIKNCMQLLVQNL